MKKELVSIIVPVYNVEKFLKKCIDSILGQTYKNIEVVLIDDGSSDRSGCICDEYANIDERVKVHHQKNRGPSVARNKGLELSEGEYISFVDSDDYIEKNAIEFLLSELINNEADVSACAATLIDIDGNSRKYLDDKDYVLDTKEAIYHSMYRNTIGSVVWAKLYKREIFNNVRFPEGKNAEDEYIVYRLMANSKKTVYKGCYLYNLIDHSSSLVNSGKGNRDMWYFDAWCQREDFLRGLGYSEYADMTWETIVREAYLRRQSIETSLARENYRNALKYAWKKTKLVRTLVKTTKIKLVVKLLIMKLINSP